MEKIILDKTIKTKIVYTNYEYYKNLGYKFDMHSTQEIFVEDLPPSSGIKVNVQCPVCLRKRKVRYNHISDSSSTICNGCARRDMTKIGKKYNRLTLLKFTENRKALFLCDCGNEKEISVNRVVAGFTKSCGCYKKEKLSEQIGAKHPSYNPNITDEERRFQRKNYEYKKFVKDVLKRDVVCQVCGKNKNLVVHHLYAFKKYKELRYEPNNGIVLCKKHHKEFHDWHGWTKSNFCTKEDFIQWLENSRGAFRVNGKLFDELINEIKRDG